MRKVLWSVLGISIFLYLLFYPQMYGIKDESAYLGMSYIIGKGDMFYREENGFYWTCSCIKGKYGRISKYPVGNSLLLVPFVSIHWKAGFIMNLIFYVLISILFIKILEFFNITPLFSLLLMLHPTFILFSRTMMSDIPSLFFILLGIYFFYNRKEILAGFSFGMSFLIRFSNIPLTISFILAALFAERDKKRIYRLFPGLVIFTFFFLLYYYCAFGSIFGVFDVMRHTGNFSIKYFSSHFLFYFLVLNLLYPGMLIITCVHGFRHRKWFPFSFSTLLIVLLYSFYYYLDKGKNPIETVVRGSRYILPVLPFMLLVYADYLKKWKVMEKIILACVPFLVLFSAGIHYKHDKFLERQKEIREIIYTNTTENELLICNGSASEFINPVFGKRKWKMLEYTKIKELKGEKNVVLVHVKGKKKYEKILRDFLRKANYESLVGDSLSPVFIARILSFKGS